MAFKAQGTPGDPCDCNLPTCDLPTGYSFVVSGINAGSCGAGCTAFNGTYLFQTAIDTIAGTPCTLFQSSGVIGGCPCNICPMVSGQAPYFETVVTTTAISFVFGRRHMTTLVKTPIYTWQASGLSITNFCDVVGLDIPWSHAAGPGFLTTCNADDGIVTLTVVP